MSVRCHPPPPPPPPQAAVVTPRSHVPPPHNRLCNGTGSCPARPHTPLPPRPARFLHSLPELAHTGRTGILGRPQNEETRLVSSLISVFQRNLQFYKTQVRLLVQTSVLNGPMTAQSVAVRPSDWAVDQLVHTAFWFVHLEPSLWSCDPKHHQHWRRSTAQMLSPPLMFSQVATQRAKRAPCLKRPGPHLHCMDLHTTVTSDTAPPPAPPSPPAPPASSSPSASSQ